MDELNKPAVHFPATVMLIDAAYLNLLITDIEKHFENLLHRELQQISVADMVTYFALDAGLKEGENEVQVIFVYDKDSNKLSHCVPERMKEDFDGMAFHNNFGEFVFASVAAEDMVSTDDLFIDLLQIVSNHSDVKRMLVVSHNEKYGNEVDEVLKEIKDKDITMLRMDNPTKDVSYHWDILAYPLMQALGIKGEELQ
jgi:hypothetical protein